MSQSILRNEDFKTGTLFNNVRGLTYKSSGSPVNRISAANAGAIYIDDLTGQLWLATASGEPATWRPYFAEVVNNIRIDSDVQEGDLIGIFGLGSWSTAGSISISRNGAAGFGTQTAGVLAAGQPSGAFLSTTELFNGSTWVVSGALTFKRYAGAGAGAQNAGLLAGGNTGGSAGTRISEIFNGATWVATGNLNLSRSEHSAGGTQNAGFVAQGSTTAAANTNSTELFNGSIWTVGPTTNQTLRYAPAAGAQNAALVVGGITNTGSLLSNATELFNGTGWAYSGVISYSRGACGVAGSQNAAIVAGGQQTASYSVAQLFNGSVWASTGSMAAIKTTPAAGGSQSAAFVAGGYNGTVFLKATELHTQAIYRKLTYNSAQCALNVGMAYNVTATSLTASLMRGDLPSTYIPGNALSTTYSNSVWFGISRHNNVDNDVYVSSATATISSISTSVANQATLNLSVAITSGFAIGSLLLISNGTKVPIIGGTELRPLVKWENVSNSASSSLTVACLWGQRIKYDSVNITSSGTLATVTQVSNVQLTTFYKGRVGDTLLIPYASVSGTNGSALYNGSYLIQSISYPTASTVAYLINLPFSVNNITESSVGGTTLLQQIVCKAGAFSTEDIVLGYRNKMRNPMNPIYDDMSNGLI